MIDMIDKFGMFKWSGSEERERKGVYVRRSQSKFCEATSFWSGYSVCEIQGYKTINTAAFKTNWLHTYVKANLHFILHIEINTGYAFISWWKHFSKWRYWTSNLFSYYF